MAAGSVKAYNRGNLITASSNPSSPITGDVYWNTTTASLWVYDGSAWVDSKQRPSCGLYLQAAAISGTGWNKTAFGSGTEEWKNVASMHDVATNNSRLTLPVAGIWFVVWRYTHEATMQTGAQIRFNGAAAPTNSNGRYSGQSAAGVSWVTPSAGADMFQMAANDYIEMYTINTTSSTNNSHFRLAATLLST